MVREAQTGDEGPKALEREAFEICLQKGRDQLMLAIASHQREWKGSFQRWIDQLDEPDYQNIREFAEFEYDSGDKIPLWQMGFWNLVSDVLSHDAVMKLRDQGSFYHLIPKTPTLSNGWFFGCAGLRPRTSFRASKEGCPQLSI